MKVKVVFSKNKKYLAELIGDEFHGWRGKKILISAPTGMGKTTFVVKILLDDAKLRGGKILILCNRRMLRQQFWYEMVRKFDSYAEISKYVKIMTYQELAEMLKRQIPLQKIVNGFATIVCDECHYFYADSDFNGYGTYVLLQEIISAGAMKTMLFLSATMDEVGPLIMQTVKKGLDRLMKTERRPEIRDENMKVLNYDFSDYADYDRFRCTCVPDWETLCGLLAESSKKSLIFLNDKEKGNELADKLVKTGKIRREEIFVLNADNMDIESEIVQYLAISHKLLVKILITTAVLDNGISIQDPEVGNVVIETESRVEFLQMLGRVRSESVKECNLYFVQRDWKAFFNRKNQYKMETEKLEKLTLGELRQNREYYLQKLWDEDEEAKFYRKVLVWMKFASQLYVWPPNETILLHQKEDFYVNEFTKRKIGDMYATECRFYALAIEDPLKVVWEQMSWIGKEPDELCVLDSTYREMKEQELVQKLLTVQNFTLDQMDTFKKELVKEYSKDIFSGISTKNGTISRDKLEEICSRFDLQLMVEKDTENRKNLYSIKKSNQEEESEEQ